MIHSTSALWKVLLAELQLNLKNVPKNAIPAGLFDVLSEKSENLYSDIALSSDSMGQLPGEASPGTLKLLIVEVSGFIINLFLKRGSPLFGTYRGKF